MTELEVAEKRLKVVKQELKRTPEYTLRIIAYATIVALCGIVLTLLFITILK